MSDTTVPHYVSAKQAVYALTGQYSDAIQSGASITELTSIMTRLDMATNTLRNLALDLADSLADAHLALRDDLADRGCSCGMADYGTDGHDGGVRYVLTSAGESALYGQ